VFMGPYMFELTGDNYPGVSISKNKKAYLHTCTVTVGNKVRKGYLLYVHFI